MPFRAMPRTSNDDLRDSKPVGRWARLLLILPPLALYVGCVCPSDHCWYSSLRGIASPGIPEFYDCTILGELPPCVACVRHENNGSFEWHDHNVPLTWAGDSTRVVEAEQGVTPCSWRRMLRFEATTPFGPSDQREAGILQVIDLRDELLPHPAKVSMLALVNRVPISADNRFGLTIEQWSGNPFPFPSGGQQRLTERTEIFTSDNDPVAWQRFSVETDLVEAADFLVVQVSAIENVANDEFSQEFEGHYLDGVEIRIGPSIYYDLRLAIESDRTEAGIDDEVEFMVRLANDGPHAASSVAVGLSLPPDLAYNGHGGAGDFDAMTGRWLLDELDVGQEVTLRVRTTVQTVGEGQQAVTTARVDDGIGTDVNAANNTASAVILLGASGRFDLQLQAWADQESVNQGDMVTFWYRLTNLGPDIAKVAGLFESGPLASIDVHDLLPKGFYFSEGVVGSAELDSGALVAGRDLAANGSRWSIRRSIYPSPDSALTLRITAQAASEGLRLGNPRIIYFRAPAGRTAAAVRSSFVSTADPLENNEAHLSVGVSPNNLPYDLSVAVGHFSVGSGNWLYGSVAVANSGPGTASNVVLSDPVPQGLMLFHPNVHGPGREQVRYDPAAGTWTIPFILPGEAVNLSHTYGMYAGTFEKTAALTTGTYSSEDSSNNSDSATLTVDQVAETFDLRIEQSADWTDVEIGDLVTVTLRVTNDGPGVADDVWLRNSLFRPLNLEVPEAFFPLDRTDHQLGAISAGQTATAILRLEAASPGSYINTARIRTRAAGDTDATNDESSVVFTISLPVEDTERDFYDLSLETFSSQSNIEVGDQIIFTLSVRKNPSFARDPGIVVHVPMPDGITFLTTFPDDHPGTYDPAIGEWRFTMLGLTAGMQIFARADSAGTYTIHAEIVDGLGVGDSPANNSRDWTFTVQPAGAGG